MFSARDNKVLAHMSILVIDEGLSSILLQTDSAKQRVDKMVIETISDQNRFGINIPPYLKNLCKSRLKHWIDNSFLAKQMQPGREYLATDSAIYPVDYESTGVIETNKKWGDGLQQFLEMKHRFPLSRMTLSTNFLSNIAFFERYGANIFGVSGTLGNDAETAFLVNTFSVQFVIIPPFKRRKVFELDGVINDSRNKLERTIFEEVESKIAIYRAAAVLVINM